MTYNLHFTVTNVKLFFCTKKFIFYLFFFFGVEQNRTATACLQSKCSTIKLQPHNKKQKGDSLIMLELFY